MYSIKKCHKCGNDFIDHSMFQIQSVCDMCGENTVYELATPQIEKEG